MAAADMRSNISDHRIPASPAYIPSDAPHPIRRILDRHCPEPASAAFCAARQPGNPGAPSA